jgi:hypothetical protein
MLIYKISKKEIIRRQKAFLSLSIFLIIGSLIGIKIFNFSLPVWFCLISLIILILSNIWIRLFFKKFLKMKIYLSKKFLERKTNKKSDKFCIAEIEKIRIKKNTKNKVREIYIYLKNNQSIFINGLNNFEKFTDKLLSLVSKKTVIKYQSEPLDFDSQLFYPILGLIISFGTIYFLKLMMNLEFETAKIILYCLLVYIILVCIYLVLSKPISKRY